MFRVITKYKDETGQIRREKGPWHPGRGEAEYWADTLRALGYKVDIKGQSGHGDGGGELAKALAGMA